ncbi:MAG: tRNA adenosine(34) deaminase TadA [Pseudomonadales bacterium]
MRNENLRNEDLRWMREAMTLARDAAAAGEVPVGALLVVDGDCIARAGNAPITACDPSAHAEIQVLRQAAAVLDNYRLPGATLYVTIEPCTMCFGAMQHARIARLVYGAREPRAGVIESQLKLAEAEFYNHRIAVRGGVCAEESAALLQEFFRQRR